MLNPRMPRILSTNINGYRNAIERWAYCHLRNTLTINWIKRVDIVINRRAWSESDIKQESNRV